MDHPLPLSRRNFLKTSAALGAAVMNPRPVFPLEFQTFPKVGIERCRRYDYDPVRAALAKLFDGIGYIPALVKGKTVTIKVNLTSYMAEGVYSLSSVETVHTHPVVVLAACSLFQEYGARRMIICESFPSNDETLQAFNNHSMMWISSNPRFKTWSGKTPATWGPDRNTAPCPWGGAYLSPFHFNHRYAETDVMVSIAKMKNHDIAITLSMKTCSASRPTPLRRSGKRGHDIRTLCMTNIRPAADGEIQPVTSHDPGFRVPRIVTDLPARPIDSRSSIPSSCDRREGVNGCKRARGSQPADRRDELRQHDAVTASGWATIPMPPTGPSPLQLLQYPAAAADRNLGTNNLDQIE